MSKKSRSAHGQLGKIFAQLVMKITFLLQRQMTTGEPKMGATMV